MLIGSVALLSLLLTLEPAGAQGGAPDSLPPAPGAPTVYDDGLHALTVIWTEPNNADPAITGYDLEYRRRDHSGWLSGPQGETETSATITDLEPDKNYYVRVRARNTNGAGDWSAAGEGTTALYVGTLTARDGVNYRGYRRTEGEPYGGRNSPGDLVPRSLTYGGAEYRIITLAWCRCVRRASDGLHTTAIDFYLYFNAAPNEWVLRVEDDRWLLSDAERANLESFGLKAYWPHISPDWEQGGQYEVSLSRNPLLSSSGSGTIRGPLTAEMQEIPGTHNARRAFQFKLSFSEDIANRKDDIRGAVLSVVGGSISDVSQLHVRSHREWRVTIQPSGAEDVSITLQGGRECGTSGAVCTEDGRRLSQTITKTVAGPEPPAITGQAHFGLGENGTGHVARFTASDPDSSRLTWQSPTGVDSGAFTMDRSGNLRFLLVPDFEAPADADHDNVYEVTVRVSDGLQVATHDVTVAVTDRNDPPTAFDDEARTFEDEPVTIDVLDNDRDPDDGDTLTLRVVTVRNGAARIESDRTVVFTPRKDHHGDGRVIYEATDSQGLTARATAEIEIEPVNDPPRFPSVTASRAASERASEGDSVGAPVRATDIEGDTLTYSLSGAGASAFDVDEEGQITVGGGTSLDVATRDTYIVTLTATDSGSPPGSASVQVTITVIAGPAAPPITSGRFVGLPGGGGPSGPTPSEADFEWTVKHDIEALDSGHDSPTGMWSDGTTLWVANNPDGAGDAVYAYDLATGERIEDREFDLDGMNRAPRGVWSDRETFFWVSDSGQDKLFAHDIATGGRTPARDIKLDERNADPRGIWSDDETMWVLDGRRDALFAYGLSSGTLRAEFALGSRNSDPRGIWSDGVTIWISDHGLKQLWAYRLPALPDSADPSDEERALERVRDEDFTHLSGASNNSPRGMWADGDLMYVADASDGKVYTYNMPDALDARLASLALSGITIGEFDPGRTDYEGVIAEDVSETVVTAEAMQRRTDIVIVPPDADEEAEGHQVVLAGVTQITVTVTSADGSRIKTYRVALEPSVIEVPFGPTWTSFEWPGPDGVAVAEAGLPDEVTVVYTWDEATGSWLAYFPSLDDVPGLNTLTAFSSGATYWVAAEEDVTWTVETQDPAVP